jgi:hypothetical protein
MPVGVLELIGRSSPMLSLFELRQRDSRMTGPDTGRFPLYRREAQNLA